MRIVSLLQERINACQNNALKKFPADAGVVANMGKSFAGTKLCQPMWAEMWDLLLKVSPDKPSNGCSFALVELHSEDKFARALSESLL